MICFLLRIIHRGGIEKHSKISLKMHIKNNLDYNQISLEYITLHGQKFVWQIPLNFPQPKYIWYIILCKRCHYSLRYKHYYLNYNHLFKSYNMHVYFYTFHKLFYISTLFIKMVLKKNPHYPMLESSYQDMGMC